MQPVTGVAWMQAVDTLFARNRHWRFDHLRLVCPQKRVPVPWDDDNASKDRLFAGLDALVQHLPVSENGMPVAVIDVDEGLDFVVRFWSDIDSKVLRMAAGCTPCELS